MHFVKHTANVGWIEASNGCQNHTGINTPRHMKHQSWCKKISLDEQSKMEERSPIVSAGPENQVMLAADGCQEEGDSHFSFEG